MSERQDYATAEDGDVEKLRGSFERGAAWTKQQAATTLGIPDRRFRAAIAALRLEGYPVVSWSEEGSVYRKAHDRDELERFLMDEVHSRRMKLERQERAMRTHGPTWLKPQTSLF